MSMKEHPQNATSIEHVDTVRNFKYLGVEIKIHEPCRYKKPSPEVKRITYLIIPTI